MGSPPQKGPKLGGFRGSSLAQAIQGNFDHIMAFAREVMRAHNLVVDDIESLADQGSAHTNLLGQHEGTLEDHETRIVDVEDEIITLGDDAATERSRNNRKPPGMFYDRDDDVVWAPPKGDKGDTGLTGATGGSGAAGAQGAPVPWPGADGDDGFFIPPGEAAAGSSPGSGIIVRDDTVDVTVDPTTTLTFDDTRMDVIDLGSGEAWVTVNQELNDLSDEASPQTAHGQYFDFDPSTNLFTPKSLPDLIRQSSPPAMFMDEYDAPFMPVPSAPAAAAASTDTDSDTQKFNFPYSLCDGQQYPGIPMRACTVTNYRGYSDYARNSDITIDVKKNGSTVFSAATKPKLAAAGGVDTARVPDTLTWADGDIMTIHLSGSNGNGPAVLTMKVVYV